MSDGGALRVVVGEGHPPAAGAWDELARANGSLVQSTLFDVTQTFFSMTPVYFAAQRGERLCGGVKLYVAASRKVPVLSARMTLAYTQLGEILAAEGEAREDIRRILDAVVRDHLRARRAVTLRVSGLYGGSAGLLAPWPAPSATWAFNVASIDLTATEEDLWSRLHSSHRTKIGKAGRNAVEVSHEADVAPLIELMKETYKGQEASGPDRGYVRHLASSLPPGVADLFYAVREREYLAGILVLAWGGLAYYQFGGTARVNVGAGAYLHWKVVRHYRERGFRRYVLGQTAASDDPGNPRFAVGITRFKRQFGPSEEPSGSASFVLKHWHHRCWKAASALAGGARSLVRWTTRR